MEKETVVYQKESQEKGGKDMENKSNKGMYVVVGILIALIFLLMILVLVMLLGEKGHKQGETGNAGPYVVNDGTKDTSAEDSSDIFGTEKSQKEGIAIVIDGFQFQVPSDYNCMYGDGIGPVIYLEDVFQMKLGVQDTSYEEIIKNPDLFTEKTVNAGGKILQEVKEAELGGNKYTYFRMKLESEENFVVCTQALDTEQRICGQIVIQKEGLSDEDLLNIFASVISSAQKTDEPDSTKEDIVEETSTADVKPGMEKKESTMMLEEGETTFLVPEDFYSQGQKVQEYFLSGDYAIRVYCSLLPVEAGTIYESAQKCIEVERNGLFESVREETELQTMDMDGTTVYYIEMHYEYDSSDIQRIYAACDIGKGAIYKIEASAIDEDVELSIDTIRDFLVLK